MKLIEVSRKPARRIESSTACSDWTNVVSVRVTNFEYLNSAFLKSSIITTMDDNVI
jgi:hypothetical protein